MLLPLMMSLFQYRLLSLLPVVVLLQSRMSFILSELLRYLAASAIPGLFSQRYIRPGAEQEINVSDRIRNKILASEITR